MLFDLAKIMKITLAMIITMTLAMIMTLIWYFIELYYHVGMEADDMHKIHFDQWPA